MTTAQVDLCGRELISRMSLVAADPDERFGSKSPRSSPPSYASSEATEPSFDPRPDRVPWDVVQKQHEEWMASAHSMQGSMDNFRPLAKHLKKWREQEEQEFTRRTGVAAVLRRRKYHACRSFRTILIAAATTFFSYGLDSGLTQQASGPPKQAPTNVDTILAKARLPLRRSARIAQIREEQNSLAPQKAFQLSSKGPAPRKPRGRAPKRQSLREKISRGGIAKSRGRPLTRRSQQEENSRGGITKKRGRPRKIHPTTKEGIATKTG